MPNTVRLLVTCRDRTGVVAAVSALLSEVGANILDADQHADPDDESFFMRIRFTPPAGSEGFAGAFEERFAEIADALEMTWRVRWPGEPPRVAILTGPTTHCLADLLWRASIGELRCGIVSVLSNHEAGRELTESFKHEFVLAPTEETSGPEEREAARARHEAAVLELLEAACPGGPDLVVLARYMQILTPAFVRRFPGRIINIHHSFLPAFAGARPYHRAFERGVKLIGATAHYVTEELDEGPIIAQDTARVSHRDTVDDMIRKGRDLERRVLAEAVRLHLDDRVLISGGKTVVFE